MNVQSKAPTRGKRQALNKNSRISQDEALAILLEEHKQSLGDMVWIRIDDRTHIELPAAMSEADRQERIENYLKNSNFKPAKGLLKKSGKL